jgi:hypothetical protein
MQIAASTPLRSIFGYGSTEGASALTPIQGMRQTRSGSSWSLEEQAFGAAILREARRGQEYPLYDSKGRLFLQGSGASDGASSPEKDGEVSAGDRAMLEKLKARDALVRGHENAHILSAGGQAGQAQYTYQTGPDGKAYAIGGSVNISIVSSPTSPEQAAGQAQVAARAAMAAGEMSPQDMQVARRATEISARARSRAMEAYAAQSE